ncbi:MAG TPA: PKD domain-containing protein, partial [Bacteroidia bacterium]|nr:PKD domain-containing protein [Bacteroidia bacterium]
GSATANPVGGTLPYTYNWSNGQTNVAASGLTAGSYTVTVHDANGCIATASVTITQPPLLTASTGVPVNVLCNGGSNGSDLASAAGGTGAYTFSWAPGGQTNANATGLTAGAYTITVTDANGCTATANTTITQPTALALAAAGFPVTCNGGSDGQATAIPAGGTPAYAYLWTPSGGTNAIASNLSAGTYTITVTDAHGCSHDTAVVVSQPAPIIVTFSADSLGGCAPLCVNFKDLTIDAGGIVNKWNWSFGDGGTDTVKDPRHCYSNPGSYTVTLTVVDNHGCTSTLVINSMITVYSFPVPAFTFGPQPTTIANPIISFTDKSTDAYGIATWLWNFSDPTNDVPSNLQNPSHTYGDTGTFCATLTVTNIHGCKDSVTECLIIGPEFTLYIPDAFSPNGDGHNETFTAKGTFITSFKMYIFDRWGMMLYYTEDMNKGWNGTVNGGSRVCQEDTYVYMIEAIDMNQGKHNFIGKVTLLK